MAQTQTSDSSGVVAARLREPYARIVIPEADGTYRGEILEFPGCFATGDTPAETLENLEDVAASWLEAALGQGQPIPAPVENTEFSGRLVLRMPRSLHKKAARIAEREGVSLNQFIVTSLAEQIGERRRPAQNHITLNAISNTTNIGTIGVAAMNFAGADQRFSQRAGEGAAVTLQGWIATPQNWPLRRTG